MEKSQKIVQVYGYTVCLVAIITFIISIASLINSLMDLEDPLHASWSQSGAPSLASYENYKMDILKAPQKEAESLKSAYVPDDNTLRAMYESAKGDKIQQNRHQSNRSIIQDSFLILICIVLFLAHWRWMRKILKAE